jgi:hypothetical protein
MANTDLRLISTRFPADLVRRIDALAAAQRQTRAAVMERLLLDSLDQAELSVRALTDPLIGPALAGALAKPGVLRALMATLREDLKPEQMQMFGNALQALEVAGAKAAKLTTAHAVTPRQRPRSRRRAK